MLCALCLSKYKYNYSLDNKQSNPRPNSELPVLAWKPDSLLGALAFEKEDGWSWGWDVNTLWRIDACYIRDEETDLLPGLASQGSARQVRLGSRKGTQWFPLS